ncbi:PAS domain S-box protein [Aeromicrobium sp. NPDC092404]|uniref:PAS domain S-box protein n=1 Tax=Aeromicrobium sp. NPDC092404 TaxID=3154976 RepID=UPI00342ABA52
MGNNTATVVLIDDSAEVRELLKTQFRLSGLLTVVADGSDGVEAIGLAHRHTPDLLLLDLSMPSMDGLDALHGILTVSPHTRVVIYTGFESHGLAERALELGATAFLEKSVPIEQLATRLTEIFEGSPAPTGPPTLQAVPDRPDPGPEADERDDDQSVLDEHLEQFREVFEEAAIGMATMTLTGTIVRANRALGDILLRKHQDLVGLDYAALTAGQGDSLATALDEIQMGVADLVHLEHEVYGAPETRHVRASIAAVRDTARQPLYLFLQVQDITAQRAAEQRLRISEERFRLLVDAVEEYAIFMLSPEGIIVSWNAGAQRTKGYRADEIIGRHFRTFYPIEQQEARHPEYELERAIADGHYSEEGWRIRKDGTSFWAHVLITAVFDEAGQHVGFTKVTRDITSTREATEALRQSEERFRLLVEAVGDYAIFMLDPDGHVVSWNSGAQRNTGYTSREIIGQHFRIFYPPESQAAHHPEHELRVSLRDGRYEEEGWRVREDGSHYWAHVVITAVHNDVGHHIGFAKVTRDRTEQRLIEQEREQTNIALNELNERLQQAAADQSQFLAVTAHELRTPGAVLRGSADTLSRHWAELGDQERTGLLEGMTSSADRLGRLLNDLLTASKLDANALNLRPVRTSVTALISTAVDNARLAKKGVDIQAGDVADVDVMVDPSRYGQVLDNLIGNAVVHGAPPVTLHAVVDGRTVQIRVHDSGDGVDAAILPRLFERFATADNVRGSGLGLFIVRELAKASGGDAYYEPATDDSPGGTFVVTAPLA